MTSPIFRVAKQTVHQTVQRAMKNRHSLSSLFSNLRLTHTPKAKIYAKTVACFGGAALSASFAISLAAVVKKNEQNEVEKRAEKIAEHGVQKLLEDIRYDFTKLDMLDKRALEFLGPKIEKLNLGYSNDSFQALQDIVRYFPNLTELALFIPKLSDEEIKLIATLQSLKVLNCSCVLEPKQLLTLATLPHITSFSCITEPYHLESNFKMLAHFPCLEELSVHTKDGFFRAIELCLLPKIKKLALSIELQEGDCTMKKEWDQAVAQLKEKLKSVSISSDCNYKEFSM